MPNQIKKKEERKDDFPILFFFGLGLSGALIYFLNKKKPAPEIFEATLNGTLVNSGNYPLVTAYFEWGETEALGSVTPETTVYNGQQFSTTIVGLKANTTYYFRAVAISQAEETEGDILSFTTSEEEVS